jgi:hypothetical protein
VARQTTEIKLAADLALILGQRPTAMLELEDAPGSWRVIVDYMLITQARERLATGENKATEEQIREMKKLYEVTRR